ncbi:MAG: outer membrane beta-barrel protein [Gemmatimonadota bacterium]
MRTAGISSRCRKRTLLALGLLLLAGGARAQAQTLEDYDYTNLGFRALGVEARWVDASQNEATIGIGIRVDMGFLGPYIRIVPRAGWWNADVNDESVRELERQLEEVSDLPAGSINLGSLNRTAWNVGLDVQWTLQDAVLAPYLGVGGDLFLLDDDGDAIDGTFLDSAVITAGLSGVVGAEFNFLVQWRIYSELRGTRFG